MAKKVKSLNKINPVMAFGVITLIGFVLYMVVYTNLINSQQELDLSVFNPAKLVGCAKNMHQKYVCMLGDTETTVSFWDRLLGRYSLEEANCLWKCVPNTQVLPKPTSLLEHK